MAAQQGQARAAQGIRGLSLRQLEVFHAIYSTRSISAASRHLGISQPVVSRMLRRLEDVLGLTLFQRSGMGLMPSMEAQLIFGEVDGLVARIDGLGTRIEEIASGGPVAFRLGATASVARSLVPRALKGFGGSLGGGLASGQGRDSSEGAGRAPRPDLFFDVLSVDQIGSYLLEGTGQCVVTLAPVDHPMLATEVLGQGQLVAVIPAGHPLATKPDLEPADFVAVDLISFQVDGPHQRAIHHYLGAQVDHAAGHSAGQPRTVVRFADTAVAMAAEGMAIALVDSFTTLGSAGMGSAAEGVVLRPLAGQEAAFTLYLQWNTGRPVSAHLDSLRRLLVQALAQAAGERRSR